MKLVHNMAALSLYYQQKKTESAQSVALNRISSGLKINGAKDGASGLEESERMRMQIRGMQMAARNAQDGMSMLQTAEGGMSNISDMIDRMRELVVESGDSSKTDSDKKNIQLEIDQLKKGIEDTAKNTEFNGKPLLGSKESSEIPISDDTGAAVKFSFYNVSPNNIGTKDSSGNLTKTLADVNVSSLSVDENLGVIDNSLKQVLDVRAQYGALEGRFEDTYNNLNAFIEGVQTAESGVRDADVAEEMMNYTKSSVLDQAGDAMLAQAEQFPKDVLNILSSLRSK